MGDFKGKTILITGGTKGIGLAVAKRFAQDEAIVIACARHPVDFANNNIHFCELDISNRKQCQKVFSYIKKSFGGIDVLINNAGIMMDRTTAKMTDEEFDSVIDTNIKGTFNVTRLFGPDMKARGSGTIISLSSFVAIDGSFGQANYCASKAAIEAMTKCWAKEFSSKGEDVVVLSVRPGIILTDIFSKMSQEQIDQLLKNGPIHQITSLEEIAERIYKVAVDRHVYPNGSAINLF